MRGMSILLGQWLVPRLGATASSSTSDRATTGAAGDARQQWMRVISSSSGTPACRVSTMVMVEMKAMSDDGDEDDGDDEEDDGDGDDDGEDDDDDDGNDCEDYS